MKEGTATPGRIKEYTKTQLFGFLGPYGPFYTVESKQMANECKSP